MDQTIDVGKAYFHRLANRDKRQGDGKHTAFDFRNQYLSRLVIDEKWVDSEEPIKLDFTNVTRIGPSFANEAFAYFTKYTNIDNILKKIKFLNIKNVHKIIIETELKNGYRQK